MEEWRKAREGKPEDCGFNAGDLETWRRIVVEQLTEAKRFEIHCWNEEQEEIALALQLGNRREQSGWDYGVIVEGPVTPQFRERLLTLPKPADTGIYDKMTPFFSIFLDNGFSSEHYGTELWRGKSQIT